MLRDLAEVVVVVALFVALAVAMVVGICEVYGRHTCTNYAIITGKQTRWLPIDTCYVHVDGVWYRYEEHKARIIAERGLTNKQ